MRETSRWRHEHKGAIWLSVTQGPLKDRIIFGKLEVVGQFESLARKTRTRLPPPLPEGASGLLQPGVKLFTDREHAIDQLPEPVRGLPALPAQQHRKKTDVTVTNPGTLFALTPTIRPRAAS